MQPFIAKASARVARDIDRIFCGAALNPPKVMRARSSAESLGHDQRMRGLAAIQAFYGRKRHFAPDTDFFTQPSIIHPEIRKRRDIGNQGEVLDLSWPSEFAPLWSRAAVMEAMPEVLAESGTQYDYDADVLALRMDRSGELAEKYARAKRNATCHARWWRHHKGNRPCIVLLHGYMAGNYAMEELVWPVRRLFDSGFDVVIGVLPFHGPRRSEKRGLLPPSFPSADPRFTIEGFRQVVVDKRALFDFLRRAGVASLGVMGMSLGGYSSALLSTIDAQLDFSVLFIPLASIEDFAHRHGRLTGDDEQQRAQWAALRDAQWVVSPFARPSLLPQGRSLVIAGESDLVTGRQDAERLAAHFGAPLQFFPGGHLLHFGRDEAFKAVWQLLGKH